jgi:hypothetical protein
MVLNNEHISITQNLYDALRHVRFEDSNREIWVDTLCINQADIPERNHQVSLMGDIYSSAVHVVNWLGPATQNTALGMKTLEFLLGEEDVTVKPPWEKHRSSLIHAGLNDILKRNYFQRIWVVQENALASKLTLQAGFETVTWHRGAETHRAICRIKFAVLSPSWEASGIKDVDFRPLLEVLEQNMMVTRQKLGMSCRVVTLLDLAFDMRYRQATDRRDMLFGLRNLVPEEIRKHIVVDYDKPVEKLYEEFYKTVKGAYQAEIKFVEKCEKERRAQVKAEQMRLDKARSSSSMGSGW